MTPEPACVPEEPRYKLRWVFTLPRINPLIARDCMAAPVPWLERLARQVVPRTRIRDCCWHHGIDWRQAAAVAITIARRVRREHVTGEEALFDRVFELIQASGLPELQQNAVEALLYPGEGITIDHLAGDRWRLSYLDGRKRTHAMLESGVHRTVIIRWRAPRRH